MMLCLTRTAGTARTLLHAGQHETLSVPEINVRVEEHVVRTRFQEKLQPVDLKGRVAGLGCFGYVHSQGRASAARDQKNPYPVACVSLFFNDFFKLAHGTVRQTYHSFLLVVLYCLGCSPQMGQLKTILPYIHKIATFFNQAGKPGKKGFVS